jgi:7-carboxy-7-deazaguanine synthase
VTYSIKEIFYTLAGRGRPCGPSGGVLPFFRLQSVDRPRERPRQRRLQFCDTDFVGTDGEGGGKFKTRKNGRGHRQPVAGQLSGQQICGLHRRRAAAAARYAADRRHAQAPAFTIAIETNGTLPVPPAWTGSASARKWVRRWWWKKGSEIKVVIPQTHQDLAAYEHLDFENFFVQPMDGPLAEFNTRLAIETCKRNPKWKLSLQTHKLLQIP